MDPKDAIRHLKTLVYGSDSLRTQQKAIADSCFKELGIYIPEPIVECDYNEFECPNCGVNVNKFDKTCSCCGQRIDWNEYKENLKKKPAQPILEVFGGIHLECPYCQSILIDTEEKFCKKCGQALDWSNWNTRKEPKAPMDITVREGKCPLCGSNVIENQERCKTCGQVLLWEDEK